MPPKHFLILLFLLPLACRPLPSAGVKSFADSTATLRATLAATGQSAVQDVVALNDGSQASKSAADALSKTLATDWQKRDQLLLAMTRYADALSALVQSGTSAQSNAAAFTNSLKSLLDTLQVAFPADAGATALLDTATATYAQIARAIAANHIAKAVARADPLISGTPTSPGAAQLIAQDLNNLRALAVNHHRLALAQLQSLHDDIRLPLKSLNEARAAQLRNALANPDPAAFDLLKKLDDASAALAADPRYAQYQSDLANLDTAYRAQLALLDQAAATVTAWGDAHHRLALAMQTKSAPSLQDLTQFTADLYTIYRTYRAATAAANSPAKP